MRWTGTVGSPRLPRTGSEVSRADLAAAVIDSRDFLAAEARSENEADRRAGIRIAFAGGSDSNGHKLIPNRLGAARAEHSDMMLRVCCG